MNVRRVRAKAFAVLTALSAIHKAFTALGRTEREGREEKDDYGGGEGGNAHLCWDEYETEETGEERR